MLAVRLGCSTVGVVLHDLENVRPLQMAESTASRALGVRSTSRAPRDLLNNCPNLLAIGVDGFPNLLAIHHDGQLVPIKGLASVNRLPVSIEWLSGNGSASA
jgi:hypothetical protein